MANTISIKLPTLLSNKPRTLQWLKTTKCKYNNTKIRMGRLNNRFILHFIHYSYRILIEPLCFTLSLETTDLIFNLFIHVQLTQSSCFVADSKGGPT